MALLLPQLLGPADALLHDRDPRRLNFGNVVQDGVAGVWDNEAYNAFRTRSASDDPPEICRGCAVYNGTF